MATTTRRRAGNITISWSRFENHRKTVLIGTSRRHPADRFITATLHHNYYTRTVQRHPRVRYAKVDIYNNYVEGWGTDGSFGVDPTRYEDVTSGNGIVTTCGGQVLVEGNIFERKSYSQEAALEYSASDDPAGSCKRGSATYSNYGAGRSLNNWRRDGGGGLPTANSFQESLVFGRPYAAYSLQNNVQQNEAFRVQLMSLPGSK